MNGLWSSLRFRLLFLIIGIALITLLTSVYILFSFQSKQLFENARTSTVTLSNIVEANLYHAMLADDWSMINDIIQIAVEDKTINTLRIVNTQGRVIATSRKDELGKIFKIQDPLCQQCHANSVNPTALIGRYDWGYGEQVLFSVNLIHNQPNCWICHTSDNNVLGLLIIETPLSLVNDQLRTGFWQTTLLAVIACGLLVGSLVPVLNRYVIQPVADLSKGVDELACGNLDYKVRALNQDELGKLAESFDLMRQQLKISYLEISQREREAVSLYQMGTKITASLSLANLLQLIAEASRDLLKADIGLVGLFDEEHQEIVIEAAAGTQAEAHIGMRMPVSPGTPGYALREGLPVQAEAFDQNNLLHPDNPMVAAERVVSILAVPLRLGDKIFGMIEVMSRNHRKFTQADAQLLMRLAQPAVVSLENAQLYRQLRYLSTLEERDRLARELHDDLAQMLGYLNVRASIADDLLSSGKVEEARESLVELKQAAKTAYLDVREQIFNLRTSVSSNSGLLSTLRNYLSEYHIHYGLETKLLYERESLANFSDETASQLLRIIQEALTNVRKHAHASVAWIRFVQEGDQICIQIEDNGQGFYSDAPRNSGRQSYGLQIMRERAESIGCQLELVSKPGHGTCVTVYLPILAVAGKRDIENANLTSG